MNLKDLDDLEKNGKKGDWCFLNDCMHIAVMYGEESISGTVVLPISENNDSAHWKWDGNKEAPTLSPSILVYPTEGFTDGWHGFLRNGLLVDA